MSIYSDKLAHVKVIFNCRDSVAKMCICADSLMPYLDDVMSYNLLTTKCIKFWIFEDLPDVYITAKMLSAPVFFSSSRFDSLKMRLLSWRVWKLRILALRGKSSPEPSMLVITHMGLASSSKYSILWKQDMFSPQISL